MKRHPSKVNVERLSLVSTFFFASILTDSFHFSPDGSSPSGITETAQGASNQNSGAPTNAMQIGFTISTSFVILMAVTLA